MGYLVKVYLTRTLGQDGGIGKHDLPPGTTTANLQLNYKTTITQNCQKIELYGSQTTKKLTKSHSSRRVGGQRCVDKRCGTAVPHPHMVDKNWERYLGRMYPSPQKPPQPRDPVPGR